MKQFSLIPNFNTIKYIVLGSALFPACNSVVKETAKPDKPNILFLIADDMGYSDLECYGGPSKTPNLNKLAEEGLKFTDFYAAAPNCSPSRSGLLTGKSPAKLGMYSYRPPQHPMHLRDSEITIAELLKAQGYQTSHIGKWHLGCLPQDTVFNHPQPQEQGFDYSLGTENNAIPSHHNPINFVRNGTPLGVLEGYSCQILANEAINWFENIHQKDDPFFMYVAFHEPHAKIASPPELIEKYKGYSKRDAEFLANIENLDIASGRIIKYLEDNQLMENTLIIFSSDNGSYRQASNGNLRAVKSYLYEGGIRVPGIFHWSGLKTKGTVSTEAAGFVDIVPTICDIINIEHPKQEELDGTSIQAILEGGKFSREKPLFWYFYRSTPEIAMRLGKYMVLGKDQDTVLRTHSFSAPDMSYIKQMKLTDYELYDLSNDLSETKNIMEQNAEANDYKTAINNQLKAIQQNGYLWKQLPEANRKKKLKTDWVKYKL